MRSTIASLPIDALRAVGWLVLIVAIFVPLERLFALHRQRILRRSFANDLGYYFLSSLLPKFLLILPLSAVAWILHRAVPSSFYAWTAAWPLLARVAGAQIVGEIGAYWAHRLMHEIPWLWRIHAVHHESEEMDWLVHTRAHPFDLLFTRLGTMVPMYVLGLAQPLANAPDLVPVLVTLIGTLWGFFIHSNTRFRLGWFEWLVSTPAFHHWHHTREEEHVDRNYAPMLPLIDKLFGTLYLPRTWPGGYGIIESRAEPEPSAPLATPGVFPATRDA